MREYSFDAKVGEGWCIIIFLQFPSFNGIKKKKKGGGGGNGDLQRTQSPPQYVLPLKFRCWNYQRHITMPTVKQGPGMTVHKETCMVAIVQCVSQKNYTLIILVRRNKSKHIMHTTFGLQIRNVMGYTVISLVQGRYLSPHRKKVKLQKIT